MILYFHNVFFKIVNCKGMKRIYGRCTGFIFNISNIDKSFANRIYIFNILRLRVFKDGILGRIAIPRFIATRPATAVSVSVS